MTLARVLLLMEGGPAPSPAAQVIAMLHNAGVDITFATIRGPSATHDEVSALGLPAIAYGARSSRDYPTVSARIARTVRRRDIEVIHSVEMIAGAVGNTASIIARRAKRLFDRQHSVAPWPLNLLSLLASQSADLIRVPSEAARTWTVNEDGVSAAKVRVVLNSAFPLPEVSQEQVAELRAELGIPKEAAVISTVARLRREKGLHVGLDALPIVAHVFQRPLHYVVVGDGPVVGELQSRARTLAVPVHFVGHRRNVAPWYALADVIWMPSLNDAMPIAAAEAMSCGRPLVASAVGGLVEAVKDGETGLLVRRNDAAMLARATLSLLMSPQKREAMGRAARERYELLFTPEAAIEGIVNCYRELLGRPLSVEPASP